MTKAVPPNGSALSYRPLTESRRLSTLGARMLPRSTVGGPTSSNAFHEKASLVKWRITLFRLLSRRAGSRVEPPPGFHPHSR